VIASLVVGIGARTAAAQAADPRPPIDRELPEKTELATFALG